VKHRPKVSRLDLWRQSAEFREIARQSVRRINTTRHLAPKCGAKAKHNGQPCQQSALENGRCRYHSGLTPKGRNWHRPQPPSGTKALAKLERKLATQIRRKKARAKRVDAMNPEERQRYEEWHRAHKPGPRTDREHTRRAREARRSIDRLLQDDEPSRAAALTGGVFD
jgi:hypothetical protein